MTTFKKEHLDAFTPREAYHLLIEGNERFINNLKINRNLLQQMNETADGQFPFAAVLSCMDSRTSAELIFDQGLGDIFSLRIAGNIVNDDIIGSMEFACKVVGSKLLVVLGHTRCGAIKGACQNVELGHLSGLLEKIKPVISKSNNLAIEETDATERVAYANVINSMNEIMEKSSIIRQMLEDGKIGIVGGIYNVETGSVQFIKEIFAGNKKESGAALDVQHQS